MLLNWKISITKAAAWGIFFFYKELLGNTVLLETQPYLKCSQHNKNKKKSNLFKAALATILTQKIICFGNW